MVDDSGIGTSLIETEGLQDLDRYVCFIHELMLSLLLSFCSVSKTILIFVEMPLSRTWDLVLCSMETLRLAISQTFRHKAFST
jgi:hypothetical protein